MQPSTVGAISDLQSTELQWETLKPLYHWMYRMWYAQIRHFLDADVSLAHRVDRPDYEDPAEVCKDHL